MLKPRWLLSLISVLLCEVASPAPMLYSITDLGTLGGTNSYALGINDLGQIVGDSLAGSATIPTLWNNDASHTPTALPWLPGGSQASALAINRQGMVIGWSNTGAAPNVRKPVLWMNGRAIDITQTLDATGLGWSEIYVSGLNDRGQIVGTGLRNGQQRACLLNPVKPTSIRLP